MTGDLSTFELAVPPDLLIRHIQADDALQVFELVDRNREHLSPFMPWVPDMTRTSEEEYAMEAVRLARHGRQMHGLIFRDQVIIGACGYDSISPPHSHRTVTLGYWLDSRETGKGIMRRCVGALIGHALTQLGMYRIEIRTIPSNVRSQKLARDLGFTLDATLRQAQHYSWGLEDKLVFSLLATEWPPGP